MKKINQFEEERLPGFLEDLKKDNPFKTPHNYFNTLPDQIIQRLQDEQNKGHQSWWQALLARWPVLNPKPVWALATMLIIISLFWVNTQNPDSAATLVEDFSPVEIAEYVQNHLDDFEVSDFYAQDIDNIDILGETMEMEELEPLLEELMDDIDLETIQRIL